jgi:hypothetical protein
MGFQGISAQIRHSSVPVLREFSAASAPLPAPGAGAFFAVAMTGGQDISGRRPGSNFGIDNVGSDDESKLRPSRHEHLAPRFNGVRRRYDDQYRRSHPSRLSWRET